MEKDIINHPTRRKNTIIRISYKVNFAHAPKTGSYMKLKEHTLILDAVPLVFVAEEQPVRTRFEDG